MSAEKLARIDAVAQRMVDDKKLAGCVIAVARNGKPAYFKSFGKADIAADKPMTNDTIFRIYSMTKSVATAGALMLVEEGKVGLDDPVSKYVPELKAVKVYKEGGNEKPKRQPTVRDLMRHTAGLTYGFFGNSAVDQMYRDQKVSDGSLQDMAECLGELPLLYEPGTKWVYSVATDVLGLVIEKASGKALDKFLAARIFEPLGMVDTGFQLPAENIDRFAANYNSDGEGKLTVIDEPSKSRYLERPKMFSGGGGLVSTTGDYMRFLQMIANGGEVGGKRLLKAETVNLMTTNQLPDGAMPIAIGEPRPGVGFGLGFSVRVEDSEWDAGGRLGEYGWGGAASTHYWISPADELIVVTMEQTMPYSFSLEFALKELIYDAIEK